MRFLLAALAAVALVSTVSAQEYDNLENVSESDFDISGSLRGKQSIKAPVQQKLEAPVQQSTTVQQQASIQKVQSPIQQEKVETIMLQPILLMPKSKKTEKTLKVDIDRALAYRVSPKVSSENSRSVDISFSPILNSKMRNIMLTSEQPEQQLNFVETVPLLSTKIPKYEKQYQYTHQTPKLSKSFKNVKKQQIRSVPLQQQQQLTNKQQQQQFHQLQGAQDVSEYGSSFFNPSLTYRFSGVGATSANENQFTFLNEQPISPRAYTFTNIQDVEQPQRFQSTYMNEDMNIPSSSLLLSSINEELPAVPVTHSNIMTLGVTAPTKLNQVLKSCIVNNQQQSPVCAKVIEASKLLINHPLAEKVFDGISF